MQTPNQVSRRAFVASSLLLLAACSGPQSPAAPSGPAPAVPAGSKPRETVTLDIYTTIVVFGPEVEALRRLVNERSEWLRIRVQDTKITNEGWKVYATATPAERKRMIVWNTENNLNLLVKGLDQFFPGALEPVPMALLKLGPLTGGAFGTLNPSLRTFRDFEGKTLNHGANPGIDWLDMQDAMGLKDKVRNVAHGSDDVQVREIKDGVIDVIPIYLTGPSRFTPLQAQLAKERKLYMVDAKEAVEATYRADPNKWTLLFPWPFYGGVLPPVYNLDYDPVRESVVYGIAGRNPQFYVSPEMEEEIVYELISTVVKYRDDFHQLLPGDVEGVKAGLGLMLWPKRNYHSGARRAYDELQYPYGLAASIESEKRRAAASGQPYYLPDYMEKLVAEDR